MNSEHGRHKDAYMKSRLSLLIIEDDKYSRLNLREILQPFGIIEEATNIVEAREKLKSTVYDIVITDIELGEGSGVEIIPEVVRRGSHCIVVSSYESEDVIEKAYSSMRASGVTDDSSLVEGLGVKVRILVGSSRNIKITTKEDLKIARGLI